MIYLIDDKKDRQHIDFGWSDERFTQYTDFIKPLYSIEEIVQIGENLYDEKNIILYHESFLDFTNDSQKALDQRKKLQKIAKTKTELAVAFFSGSQGSRSLNNNIAHLPVSILYHNLEIAVKQHMKGSIELKYILFGKNPEIESELNEILIQANRLIENNSIEISGKTLFIHPDEDFIQNAISNAHTEEIYQAKDSDMSEITIKLLNDYEYDNIFIPLCFGPTLSDYNGLRLATHFRCTITKNQLKRIFIYGFVGLDYLIDHEYFNILKTKNVELVPYNKKEFELAANKNFEPLKPDELSKEIQKLKLDPPLNYAASHSIANEWAIYQWSKTIGCDQTDELTKVFQNVQANLYFKYLKAQFPVKETVSAKNQIIIEQGNILYIDDEVEKGWDSIFKKICTHKKYESIGTDFKNMNSLRIVEVTMEKVKEFEPDVIILDFRLHDDDFEKISPENVTGYKILKSIKEINKGIQVIILSATNKIWNLLELQKAGADGFILKESPELSVDRNFSKNTITNIYRTINEALAKKYLKTIYTAWKESIQTTGNSDERFISESNVTLKTTWELINSEHLDMGYLTIYQTIESYANKLYQTGDNQDSIDETTVIEKSGEKENIWKLKYNKDEMNGDYFCVGDQVQSKTQRPTTLFKVSCLFHFIYNYNNIQLKEIGKINQIRNSIAHGFRIPNNQKQHSTKDDFVKLLGLIMTIRNT